MVEKKQAKHIQAMYIFKSLLFLHTFITTIFQLYARRERALAARAIWRHAWAGERRSRSVSPAGRHGNVCLRNWWTSCDPCHRGSPSGPALGIGQKDRWKFFDPFHHIIAHGVFVFTPLLMWRRYCMLDYAHAAATAAAVVATLFLSLVEWWVSDIEV